MKTKILAPLLILSIFGACSSPSIPNASIRLHIEGIVTDASTGNPIEGAFVQIVELGGFNASILLTAHTNRKADMCRIATLYVLLAFILYLLVTEEAA